LEGGRNEKTEQAGGRTKILEGNKEKEMGGKEKKKVKGVLNKTFRGGEETGHPAVGNCWTR